MGSMLLSRAPEQFVDGGTSCTWTQKDGTKIIYYGYHTVGNPMCQSQSISSVISPNGVVATYYYSGAVSNSAVTPLLSIATSDGYLLKYNYPSTPQFGAQTSVVALNRAFQACDPAAVSCSSSAPWPTATLARQGKTVAVSDNFPPAGLNYNGLQHYLVTLTDQARFRKHVFETDSYGRVITYQPPDSEVPVYGYTLCSLLADPNPTDVHWPMKDCFGQTDWRLDSDGDNAPAEISLVEMVTKNGQVWNYGIFPTASENYPPFHRWTHAVTSPLGVTQTATGNGSPGEEYIVGPTQKVTNADGSYYSYQASVANPIVSFTAADLAVTSYTHDARQNLIGETRTPVPGSGTTGQLVRTASYPAVVRKPVDLQQAGLCDRCQWQPHRLYVRSQQWRDRNRNRSRSQRNPPAEALHLCPALRLVPERVRCDDARDTAAMGAQQRKPLHLRRGLRCRLLDRE